MTAPAPLADPGNHPWRPHLRALFYWAQVAIPIYPVIPAKADPGATRAVDSSLLWIPAPAGMTAGCASNACHQQASLLEPFIGGRSGVCYRAGSCY